MSCSATCRASPAPRAPSPRIEGGCFRLRSLLMRANAGTPEFAGERSVVSKISAGGEWPAGPAIHPLHAHGRRHAGRGPSVVVAEHAVPGIDIAAEVQPGWIHGDAHRRMRAI